MAAFRMAALVLALSSMSGAMAAGLGPSVQFAVFGDWGWGPDGDYTGVANGTGATSDTGIISDRSGQKAVAAAMANECEKQTCSFVINTGDNFYNYGINEALGVLDPQFTTSFDAIYDFPSLNGLKFYGVLGNHDYGRDQVVANHSIVPQLEYTAYDRKKRWYIPQRYYDVVPVGPKGKLPLPIHITTFDTSPFIDSYCLVPTAKYYTPELLYGCQDTQRRAQVSFSSYSLKDAAVSESWSIMVGHHPPVGGSGPNTPENTYIQDILLHNAPPQLWFNGHDHVLAHYKNPNVTRTDFFTVGSSGIADSADIGPVSPTAATDGGFLFSQAPHGFAIVKLFKTYGIIRMYGVPDLANPTVYEEYYSYTFQKRN